ncbi:glycosyltransferase [Chloroflexi bacterium TSY]|nr:glycosyltransferase [Chloroflexi bacterium TSY]
MTTFCTIFALILISERVWKHITVVRFFRSPAPQPDQTPLKISILQPILSGDPTLADCLAHNLTLHEVYQKSSEPHLASSKFNAQGRERTFLGKSSHYSLEYIWLLDDDDQEGQKICRDLVERFPNRSIKIQLLPPPAQGESPKMMKLIVGLEIAVGDLICVLDDDTMLPEDGFWRCIPYLDQPGVGLAFGLPYQVNFSNFWSSLVAYFVNSSSLVTYIPYITLNEPFTINGMFYIIYRKTLDRVGGFRGLESILADDFAVAQRFRSHGYQLQQTPLCHPINIYVRDWRQYMSLIQRWFIFPRESLMRYLSVREQLLLYTLALLPTIAPLALITLLIFWPSWLLTTLVLIYLFYSYAIFVHLNIAYLRSASPWKSSWLVPLIQIVFPLQLLVALLSPQRIVWRGHVMQTEKGGRFRFVQRR